VTADGRHRHVTADAEADPDLFWALRGAGANFGVVAAMEVDLFPVATLLGGELCFGPEASEEVLRSYVDWAHDVPETMASSVLLLAYPDDPAVPGDLRGRHVTHVRLACSGDDPAEGHRWIGRLRRIGTRVLDTVRVMPYAEVGTIHHEPTDVPEAAFDRHLLLGRFDEDAARVLSEHAGPAAGAPFLTELRAWGGALSRPPAVPNPIGGHDAAFSLVAISDPDAGTGPAATRCSTPCAPGPPPRPTPTSPASRTSRPTPPRAPTAPKTWPASAPSKPPTTPTTPSASTPTSPRRRPRPDPGAGLRRRPSQPRR
jgi:hypothetical protein